MLVVSGWEVHIRACTLSGCWLVGMGWVRGLVVDRFKGERFEGLSMGRRGDPLASRRTPTCFVYFWFDFQVLFQYSDHSV